MILFHPVRVLKNFISAPGRPPLNLKPRTTDPQELERLKKIEEEETRKRQARIFGVKE